ncbi:aconitate hydratase AcnA [Enterococcus pallens]|uniref:Aconitate hydratase n=1 Tax=Enterococcus pallens ATCC BAA-351 TaxID=1158607 RepID=R2QMB8_9ENTE|nr:aconitate hydratase AcnA [Enterococcus pallens]EOH96328.1 aconitate hydratase 1 [Enterococcus pallens ATCC BAA-351]EOU14459.1 aconitate hydratase 1 [Enterococcus pallens ATCC BAA-351]OJG81051.1 aconitate hydratase 1 [Enterococcus pallens]
MNWTKQLTINNEQYTYLDLLSVASSYNKELASYPFSIRVLLESLARHKEQEALEELIEYDAQNPEGVIPFRPSRVILQDFTGVPAVVDLAAMRDAVVKLGGKAEYINPEIPVTLVVDHSVQVDCAGTQDSLAYNTEKEFERNHERYQFLKWAQQAFDNFDVVPPETGIIHQVNLEFLSDVILKQTKDEQNWLFPDSLEGTDSHTTMINGLGVLGWGVGGIEAEAAILGEASFFPTPEVIGVELTGTLSPTATATDLALHLTQLLRNEKVVGKFVEYFGEGYQKLSLSDRATIANMAPEYGATCGYCPIDQETLNYLRMTGRTPEQIKLVEVYAKENHLFYDGQETPNYTRVIQLDLSEINSSLAGPKRPQDRIPLDQVADNFSASLTNPSGPQGFGLPEEEINKKVPVANKDTEIQTGDLALAAITSCTNTSNPNVMVAAGLLAKKAVEKGLKVPETIKTSLAPGSKIVTAYLEKGQLLEPLAELGFDIVGYGCTTCIGNSGPLSDEVEQTLKENDLVVSAVLSGNRNFEGRIHPLIKANYLASPPLVIAYALAGTVTKDLTSEPIAETEAGPVYLEDLWPSKEEIDAYIDAHLDPEDYQSAYEDVYQSNERWNQIKTSEGATYEWDEASTYIANPPFFDTLGKTLDTPPSLTGLKVLAKFGDSVTTDHISPAGNISLNSPAGQYLKERGLAYKDYNSFGSRRGNHEVMMRGTFGNIRIQNQLTPDVTGGYTRSALTGEEMSIYDAAMSYQKNGISTVILTGKDYGMGSSRDWAAKGTSLLGVKAVIAESYERIHRSNLVMMGIVPLEYLDGETAETLGLDGTETFTIDMPEEPVINQLVTVTAEKDSPITFQAKLRFDSQADVDYWKNQGILPLVIRKKMSEETN